MPAMPSPQFSGTAGPSSRRRRTPATATCTSTTAAGFRRRGRSRGCSRTPPCAEYRLFQQRIGTSRTVVVTPAAYATDNAVTLDAIAQLGPQARGVAVVHPTVTDAELKALACRRHPRHPLHAVRSDDRRDHPRHDRAAGAAGQPLGWHVQIHLRADQIVAAADLLQRLPGTVVFDHLGRLPHRRASSHPAFAVIRRHARQRPHLDEAVRRLHRSERRAALCGSARSRGPMSRPRRSAWCGAATGRIRPKQRQARRRGAVRSARRLGAGRRDAPPHPGREPGRALRIS